MGKIIDCVTIAQKIKDEVKQEVSTMESAPCLTVVLVGDNPASQTYVKNKEKVCEEVGIKSVVHRLPKDSSQETVERVVRALNYDSNIHGILVQLPLPEHLNEQRIIDCIDPRKDVDGLTVHNQGLLALGRLDEAILPCTPSGVIRIFDEIGYDLEGKDVAIVGRSNLFGKPMAQLILSRNGSPIILHSKSTWTQAYTHISDVVICAVGKPKMFNADYFNSPQVVIDVGINRDENGKLCGDVDLEDVIDTVGQITPVPRGVGVITTAMLLKNVLKCSKLLNTN